MSIRELGNKNQGSPTRDRERKSRWAGDHDFFSRILTKVSELKIGGKGQVQLKYRFKKKKRKSNAAILRTRRVRCHSNFCLDWGNIWEWSAVGMKKYMLSMGCTLSILIALNLFA